MTGDRGETGAPPPAPTRTKKNAAALSAALRANLQRRKQRERALRESAAAERKPESGEPANESGGEVKWTK
jgi:hypothetical protein